MTAAWRWWEARPRVSLTYAAPSRFRRLADRSLHAKSRPTARSGSSVVEVASRRGPQSVATGRSRLLGWSVRRSGSTAGRSADRRRRCRPRSISGSPAMRSRCAALGRALFGNFTAWTAGAGTVAIACPARRHRARWPPPAWTSRLTQRRWRCGPAPARGTRADRCCGHTRCWTTVASRAMSSAARVRTRASRAGAGCVPCSRSLRVRAGGVRRCRACRSTA